MTGHSAVPCHYANTYPAQDTPVIVWLWDASSPGRNARGVTDDDARARQAAEAWMGRSHASGARVEKALIVLASATLSPAYERTGEGWAGEHRDGRITWTPFSVPLSALAAS
jgi:hypothetical protein